MPHPGEANPAILLSEGLQQIGCSTCQPLLVRVVGERGIGATKTTANYTECAKPPFKQMRA